MSGEGSASATQVSIDLWRYFEERAAKLKDFVFRITTWILGFASVMVGLAVNHGFNKNLMEIDRPFLLIIAGVIGGVLVIYAAIVVNEYGDHLNRTFTRANEAREGESSPQKIWDAANACKGGKLPSFCRHLMMIIFFFAICFALFFIFGVLSVIKS